MPAYPPLRPSTVPAVKAAATTAILTALTTAFPTQIPSVTYGFPGEANLKPEMVFIGGATMLADWTEAGRGARNEDYDLDLFINVQHAGQTQQQVTERAFAIFQVVDKALTANQLGQDPPFRALLVHTRFTERFSDAGREAQISAVLRCFARI